MKPFSRSRAVSWWNTRSAISAKKRVYAAAAAWPNSSALEST